MPDSSTEDTQLLPWRQAQQLVGRYVDERTGIQDQQKYTEAFDLYMLSEIQRDTQKPNKLDLVVQLYLDFCSKSSRLAACLAR